MSRFFRFQKDSNHNDVVRALNACGIEAWDMSRYGFPADIYLAHGGKTAWIEIKDGEKAPSKRKLKPNTQKFAAFLERNGTELFVVNSEDEAIDFAKRLIRENCQ